MVRENKIKKMIFTRKEIDSRDIYEIIKIRKIWYTLHKLPNILKRRNNNERAWYKQFVS